NAGNVVMFGGEDASGNPLDETWIWDGGEKDWIEEAKSSDPKLSKRKSVVLAYDPANEKVLLFGGEGASKSLKNDTWLWDGHAGEWTEVNVAGAVPSPRAGAQMAYDGQNLVLFGGYTYASGKQQPLGDTWIWNGSEWTEAGTPVS